MKLHTPKQLWITCVRNVDNFFPKGGKTFYIGLCNDFSVRNGR